MTRAYRQGAVGALMDEYERASEELMRLVAGLTDAEFEVVRDPRTAEPECRSVQTVMNHVVSAGYGYAYYLRQAFSLGGSRVEVPVAGRAESLGQLRAMLAHTTATLDGRWQMSYEEMGAVQIQARWGPTYDVEQLLEHAVVHVLRHRRQIEKFLAS